MTGLVITSVLSPYWVEFAEDLNDLCEIHVYSLGFFSEDRIALGWQTSEYSFKLISNADLSSEYDFLMISGNSAFNRGWIKKYGQNNKPVIYWSEPFGDGLQKFLFYSQNLRSLSFPIMSALLGYRSLVRVLNLNELAVMAGTSSLACKDFVRSGYLGKTIWIPYTRKIDSFVASKNTRNGRAAYFGSNSFRKGLDRLNGIDKVDFYTPLKSKWMGVQWKGSVSSDLVPEIMSRYDLVILPSRYDGYGLVVVEALLAGCKVLVTSECGSAMLANYTNDVKVVGEFNSLIVSEKRECLSSKWSARKLYFALKDRLSVPNIKDDINHSDINIDKEFLFLKWHQISKIRRALQVEMAEINIFFPIPLMPTFTIQNVALLNKRNFWKKAVDKALGPL